MVEKIASEIKVIQKLSSNAEVKAICDVLLDICSVLPDNKKSIGFAKEAIKS